LKLIRSEINNAGGTSSGTGGVRANPFSHTALNGPFLFVTNISLFKVFPITEKADLRINVDAFNAFNQQGLWARTRRAIRSERNRFIGDGYFNVDAGLHKLIPIGNGCFLSLAWEVFNVTNSERFDVHAIDAISTDGNQLGVYSAGLTQSRRMQLSGRFEF